MSCTQLSFHYVFNVQSSKCVVFFLCCVLHLPPLPLCFLFLEI
jgi:hypothetical protein